MKPEVKEAWLKALRSGEYQQGIDFLRTDEGFCCLGVLCDVYDKQNNNTQSLWKNYNSEHGKTTDYFYLDEVGVLPEKVREWAGLNDSSPHVYVKKANGGINCIGLTVLNDEGKDFNQIADVIEKHF
jgi:hypothetical protein